MAEGSNQARDLLLPSMPWRLAWGSAVAEGSIHARTLSGGSAGAEGSIAEGSIHARTLSGGSAGAEGSIHARSLLGAGGLLVVSNARLVSLPAANHPRSRVSPPAPLHTGLPFDSAPDATRDAKDVAPGFKHDRDSALPHPSARSSHFIPMWTHMHPMVYIATLRMHVCVALVRHLAELFLDSFAADPHLWWQTPMHNSTWHS